MSTLFGQPCATALEQCPPPWLAVRPVLDYSVGPRAAKRGRGATPTLHAVLRCATNPVGRKDLKLRFRRLSKWSDVRVRTALALLCEYFEKLSTFDIITDERARLWCNALQIPGEEGGDYTADELRAAIDAKTASLAPDRQHSFHDKLKRYGCATPERFIAGDKVGQWRERSPVTQQQRTTAQRLAVKDQRAAAERTAFDVFPQALRARLESAWTRRRELADAIRDWTGDLRRGDLIAVARCDALRAAVHRLNDFLSQHGAGGLIRERITDGLLLEFQLEELRR